MQLDKNLLLEFENSIDTINPETGNIPVKILGFGEISIVFQLGNNENIVYKRLPIFESKEQVTRHIRAFNVYQQNLLVNKIGLQLVPSAFEYIDLGKEPLTLFLAQQKVNPENFCHKLIHKVTKDEVFIMFHLLMTELHKIFTFNRNSRDIKVGIDSQISNWAVKNFAETNGKITNSTQFLYLDTSTPMFRIDKKEAMEAELFLKSAPSFLRFILKLAFLQEVLDRYYDWRLVAIDMMANLFKEQRKDLISGCLEVVNTFYQNEAKDFKIKPITKKEILDYYENDKQIWSIFQSARKFDRFLTTNLLHKKYMFYLPPSIKR
jgi:hypothetical protein